MNFQLLQLFICLLPVLTKSDMVSRDNCLLYEDENCSCCSSGHGGVNCTIACENCVPHNKSDQCITGCIGGYYGDVCNMTCSEHCAPGHNETVICTKDGGQCVSGCLPGYHGRQCEHNCSKQCLKRVCEMNGTCIGGCKVGYYGDKCDQECGKNCKSRVCHHDRELMFNCIDGCLDGYRRSDCKLICPENCDNCYQNGSCIGCVGGFVEIFNKKARLIRCAETGLTRSDILVVVATGVMVFSISLCLMIRHVRTKKNIRKGYM